MSKLSMTWWQYERQRCTLDGVAVHLTPMQAEIVSTLLMRRGQIVSISDLIEILWPDPDHSPDCGEAQTIRQHVGLLRKRIGGVIENFFGQGYAIGVTPALALAA